MLYAPNDQIFLRLAFLSISGQYPSTEIFVLNFLVEILENVPVPDSVPVWVLLGHVGRNQCWKNMAIKTHLQNFFLF